MFDISIPHGRKFFTQRLLIFRQKSIKFCHLFSKFISPECRFNDCFLVV